MKWGRLYLVWNLQLKKIRYHAIEFDPEKIKKCEDELHKLLLEGYKIQDTYQTESGLVHEMIKL